MKFTINRKYLSDKLTIVARAISLYSPLPALAGICIEVKKDQIILTGSDSTISIQSTILPDEKNQLIIETEGSIIVESKYLLEIVRKMDFDTIYFELVDTTLLRISNQLGVFHLNGIESFTYPDLDFYKPKNHFVLSKKNLEEIYNQTAFACSEKDNRPVLTGINFRAAGSTLFCSATDTYRLARKQIHLDESRDFNITISQKALNDVVRSFEESETNDVDIYVDNKKIQFYFDGTLYQSNLLDGLFPDVERIIPQEFISFYQSDAQELVRAIDRTNFIRKDKVHLVRLECNTKEIRLKTRSSEIGDSDEVLSSALYTGEELAVTCNGKFMTDAIKALGGERVEIDFTGVLKPFRLTNPADDSALMVVVPVRSVD